MRATAALRTRPAGPRRPDSVPGQAALHNMTFTHSRWMLVCNAVVRLVQRVFAFPSEMARRGRETPPPEPIQALLPLSAWAMTCAPIAALFALVAVLAVAFFRTVAIEHDARSRHADREALAQSLEATQADIRATARDYPYWDADFENATVRWSQSFVDDNYKTDLADLLLIASETAGVRHRWVHPTASANPDALNASVRTALPQGLQRSNLTIEDQAEVFPRSYRRACNSAPLAATIISIDPETTSLLSRVGFPAGRRWPRDRRTLRPGIAPRPSGDRLHRFARRPPWTRIPGAQRGRRRADRLYLVAQSPARNDPVSQPLGDAPVRFQPFFVAVGDVGDLPLGASKPPRLPKPVAPPPKPPTMPPNAPTQPSHSSWLR